MVCTNGFFLYIFSGIYRASPTEKGTGQYCLNYSETQERGALRELRGFKGEMIATNKNINILLTG